MGNKILLVSGIAFALLLAAAVAITPLREWLRDKLLSDRREILAEISADITGQGDFAQIVKVRTRDTLSVEVFFLTPDKVSTLEKKRIVLPNRRDGFFDFHGNATNLAVSDLDGNGVLEILAPTFSERLLPQLNIYRFFPETRTFELWKASEVPL